MEFESKVIKLEKELSNPSLLYTEIGEDTTNQWI